ncbi:MAG TPA: iron-sulfur cluster assembly protein [Oligoflexia bacterium]|nr:iron-sulfur cluster assembly protein [Oligoflexia bacterium]HMR23825.1 iron-sulfur cluster assembly protein [Oligoflexia bacterium]
MNNSLNIKFSDLAKEKVLAFIEASNKDHMVLRIQITETLIDKYKYYFSLEEVHQKKPDDVVIQLEHFTTHIDAKSAQNLYGAKVDWKRQDNMEGFAIENPNKPKLPSNNTELEQMIIEELKTVYDPEIPVNVYDLGLIYNITLDKDNVATITMTLTTPNCPAAETLPAEIEQKAKSVPTVKDVKIDLTWEPPWHKDMISEAARLELGLM